MLITIGTTAAIIIALMLGWVGIQRLWGRVFSENITDEDVLAERRSCGNCGCGMVCERKNEVLIKKDKNCDYGTNIRL